MDRHFKCGCGGSGWVTREDGQVTIACESCGAAVIDPDFSLAKDLWYANYGLHPRRRRVDQGVSTDGAMGAGESNMSQYFRCVIAEIVGLTKLQPMPIGELKGKIRAHLPSIKPKRLSEVIQLYLARYPEMRKPSRPPGVPATPSKLDYIVSAIEQMTQLKPMRLGLVSHLARTRFPQVASKLIHDAVRVYLLRHPELRGPVAGADAVRLPTV